MNVDTVFLYFLIIVKTQIHFHMQFNFGTNAVVNKAVTCSVHTYTVVRCVPLLSVNRT